MTSPTTREDFTRFFEQAHIKDVVSYLRLVTNPRDELAWKRVLRLVPNVGPATASHEKAREAAGNAERSFARAVRERIGATVRARESRLS